MTERSRGAIEVLTVQEAAAELKVSVQSIARWFRDLPGVLAIPGPRGNQTLRIPRPLFEAWIAEHSRGFSMQPRKGRI